ncbi:MAG: DUF3267 domain-containing protein [Candidatus Nezhaarchaeales archaeon]
MEPAVQYVVKRLRLREAVILTLASLLASLEAIGATSPTILLGALLFIPLALLHELTHCLVARRFSRDARIRPLLKYGALALDYGRLTRNEFVAVALMPQLVIEAPLAAAWLLSGGQLYLVLALLHLAGSALDVISGVKMLVEASPRSVVSVLYDEGGGIAGSVVEDPSRRLATVYLL